MELVSIHMRMGLCVVYLTMLLVAHTNARMINEQELGRIWNQAIVV
jgi:hypothetical protein